MTDATKTTLIAGLFTLIGAIGGASITGLSQVKLAQQKFNSDLVLKALESNSPDQRLETLKLLIETNLLKDSEVKEGVRNYAKTKEQNPSSIPQVATSTNFEQPIISNSRIFLLTGNKSKESLLTSYKNELESVGFKVVGAKAIIDEGRPANEEVRYFFLEDQAQAKKIAEVLKSKLSIPNIQVEYYEVSNVKQGYIEIWFGR